MCVINVFANCCSQVAKMLVQITSPQGAAMLTKDASISTPHTACGALLPDPCAPLSDKWEGSVMDHFSAWAARSPARVCSHVLVRLYS